MNRDDQLFLESIVTRALYAATDDVSLFLESNTRLPLLFEELGEDDMSDLSKQVADARKDLEELEKAIGDDASMMPATRKMIATITKNLPGSSMIAGLNLFGRKKDIAKKVSQAAVAIDTINKARSSIFDSSTLLAKEFGKLPFVKDVMARPDNDVLKKDFNTMSMNDFRVAHRNDIDMPSDKAIATGIARSYKAPPGPPGWMAKAVDMFGGMLGLKKFPKLGEKGFKSDMMSLPFGKIMKLGAATAKIAGAASSEATSDAEYIADVGEDLQQTIGGEGGAEDTGTDEGTEGEDTGTDEGTEGEDTEGEGEEEAETDEGGGMPTLSSLLFEPVDPEDESKGTKMQDTIEEPGSIPNALGIAMRNIADSSLKSSWEGLVSKPNTANRKSFLSNLKNLKDELDKVTVEGKESEGQILLERWQVMAGLLDE